MRACFQVACGVQNSADALWSWTVYGQSSIFRCDWNCDLFRFVGLLRTCCDIFAAKAFVGIVRIVCHLRASHVDSTTGRVWNGCCLATIFQYIYIYLYLYVKASMHTYTCIYIYIYLCVCVCAVLYNLNLGRRILLCFCNYLGPKDAKNVQKVRWRRHDSFIFICQPFEFGRRLIC